MEFTPQQEKRIGLYFRISIFLKGLTSLVEIGAGLLALFVPVSYVTNIVIKLAQGELIEDPDDFIANHLVTYAHQLSLASTAFIAVYLISRGLIKIFLVIALIKNQRWAYPVSLVVLSFFVLYQVYQIITTRSVPLVGLTIFDLIVMWFIWREYEVLRSGKPLKSSTI